MDSLLAGLRAAGEPTRLRLLALLAHGELTVTELTRILRQSQPRISRHLKLLCEAGLICRFREGSWVFYRKADQGLPARLLAGLIPLLPETDPVFSRDRERLEEVRRLRAEQAARFFRENAEDWDCIRTLYVPEARVEECMTGALKGRSVQRFLDLGTGTGRILEVFAPHVDHALGIDLSPEMLRFARTRLEQAGLDHCQVRQGDVFDIPLPDASQDVATFHQVLHYLDDPAVAIREAARILVPGGLLLIADFAPHALEFLREDQAHRRLGFPEESIAIWCARAGMRVETVRTLPPENEEAPLTVHVWTAMKTAKGPLPGARKKDIKPKGGKTVTPASTREAARP